MTAISATEVIEARRSVRAFTDKPVAEELVREILTIAGNAPSNSNLQPWHVYVRTGDALEKALAVHNKRLHMAKMTEKPTFPTYPKGLIEPYRSRRFECGERLYASLGIARDDKPARIKQVMKNFQFFGAPVGIIITMHESMDMGQAMDIGIYAQSVMLLAKERGLDTCPQVSWTTFPKRVRKAFDIPRDQKVMLGIALGYGDDDDPLNHLDQPRLGADEFATLSGF